MSTGKGMSDSQPNLSTLVASSEASDVQKITFRHKRKQPEENENIQLIKEEVSEIKNQMSQVMSMLTSFGNNQKEFMDKISTDMATLNEQISNIKSTIQNVVKEQIEIKSDMAILRNKCVVTESKLITVESELRLLKTDPTNYSSVTSSIEEIMKEISERERRMKNLIFTGISESESSRKEERNEMDKNEVMKILKQINPDCPAPHTTLRLGKYDPKKKRVIKAIFTTEEACKNILRNRNNIQSHSIKVYSDKTPQQRVFLKKLTEEIKTRSENGEKNLVIKYFNGIPKIIVSQSKTSKSTKN
ncbi:unnamed protein product [Euphydryas editha]|uniref:Uncharacterized protein n=1 Tax=Euphydryas editha TaxID=104508 RepID=A0AAU9V7K8_EUPED|nr:unnamed protein product [Euphydryas editha]